MDRFICSVNEVIEGQPCTQSYEFINQSKGRICCILYYSQRWICLASARRVSRTCQGLLDLVVHQPAFNCTVLSSYLLIYLVTNAIDNQITYKVNVIDIDKNIRYRLLNINNNKKDSIPCIFAVVLIYEQILVLPVDGRLNKDLSSIDDSIVRYASF